VALEVEEVLAGDVADLVDQEVTQPVPASFPALDIVELRPGMDCGPLVP
jgi:hypothetical protein